MRELPTLSEIEADARRMQAEAVANAMRGLVRRIGSLFGAAASHTNGRTA